MQAEPDALARRIAGVHLDLAHADDDFDLLAAVARAVEPYGPVIIDLHYLDVDQHDTPTTLWPIAMWTPEQPAGPHPLHGRPILLADSPLVEQWVRAPDDALVITDITTDPRTDIRLRQRLAPRRALVLLPLRGAHPSRWQGILTLQWSDPHTPEPDERQIHRVLMHTAAGFIAARRALAAHSAALAEIHALYRLSTRINEAGDPTELLAAIIDDARLPGAQGMLLTIGTGPSGQPQTLEIIAVHGGGPGAAAALGARFEVAADPSAHLWIARPNQVLMIGDIASDPRLDAAARELQRRHGIAAMILLPLRWQGRWLGLLQLGWDAPRTFSADDHRLYQSVAAQTAAVLDNRLLVERSARAMAESRAQARTLEVVLEHLPIGVMIIDAVSNTKSLNRAGADLLTDDDEPDVNRPLPLYHPDSDRPVGPEERLSRLVRASGQPLTIERDLLDDDGTRRRLSVTAAPFSGSDGTILGTVTLFHDISAHLQRERQREQLKEAIITAQRLALAERATPLIPISARILVLPIVGVIDPERGRQLVATLLALDAHPDADVVIIDLTGVRDLDAAGAQALVQAAAALRLRGLRSILTGIRDQVAWTLVEQNIDLRGLTTHATLRAGLDHVARRPR